MNPELTIGKLYMVSFDGDREVPIPCMLINCGVWDSKVAAHKNYNRYVFLAGKQEHTLIVNPGYVLAYVKEIP